MSQWFNNILIALRFVEPEAEPTPEPTPEVIPPPEPVKTAPVGMWTAMEQKDDAKSWVRKPITIGDEEMNFTIAMDKYNHFKIENNKKDILNYFTQPKNLTDAKRIVKEYINRLELSAKLKHDKSSLLIKWVEKSVNQTKSEDRSMYSMTGMGSSRYEEDKEKEPDVYKDEATATTKFGSYKIEYRGSNHYCNFTHPETTPHPLVSNKQFLINDEDIGRDDETKHDYEYLMYLCDEHHKALLKADKKTSPRDFDKLAPTQHSKVMIPKKVKDTDPRIVFEDEVIFPTHKQLTLRKCEIERIRIPTIHDEKELRKYYSDAFTRHFEKDDSVARNKLPYKQKMKLTNDLQKSFNDYIDSWRLVDITAKGIPLDFILISANDTTLEQLSDYIWKKPNFKKI